MKHFNIILIIALIIISCKLFDDENGDNNDKKIPTPYDYELGESFELKADSSVVIRDSTNNKYYTLWFSGPVEDNRVPLADCDPNTSDGPILKSAFLDFKLIDGNSDTTDFKLEMMGCVQDASSEQVIKLANDSLVFTIEQLLPYPQAHADSFNFEDYIINLTIENELKKHILLGSYTGQVGYDNYWTDFTINFIDTEYIGDYPDIKLACCKGEYYRFQNILLFTDDCPEWWIGTISSKYFENYTLRGMYNYELDGINLRIWSSDEMSHYSKFKFILAKDNY